MTGPELIELFYLVPAIGLSLMVGFLILATYVAR